MFQKFIQFIKYNNASMVILLVFFVVGTGVFASETGREAFGQKNTHIEGIDNTVLLEVDLDKMNMDFSIEDISEDVKYFYVKYTFLDLEKVDNVWEYQLKDKTRKVSKKSGVDLDKYLVEELKEEYQSRIKYLKKQQEKAKSIGVEKKVEVSEYSGLIGKTLSLAENVFEGYNAVKVRELPTPVNSFALKELKTGKREGVEDSLTKVYDDYINKNDRDKDDILNKDDNCPDDYNPSQGDRDNDGQGDVCDLSPDNSDEVLDNQTASPTPEVIDDNTATPTPEVIDGDETGDGDLSTEISTEEDNAEEEGTTEEASDDSGGNQTTQPAEDDDAEEVLDRSTEPEEVIVEEETSTNEEQDVEIIELEE